MAQAGWPVERLLLAASLVGIAAGGALHLGGWGEAGDVAWALTTLLVLIPTAASAAAALWRRETGVDLIAVLAMVGALVLDELLAGAILAVMLTGGAALEAHAVARARRELTALLARAPRSAHRKQGEALVDVPVDEVLAGDHLVVKPGEVIPVDGVLLSERAVLDASALTGESRPVELGTGEQVHSGATNAGGPMELRATAPAAESTYAGIVRMVREAERAKSPLVRLADRWAGWFLLVTLLLAGTAWAVSGDPVRALAVLVVATPCPLILAAPAAMVAGVSRAARHGVLVKGGGPLETLAQAKVLLLDKTGTVTSGRPKVIAVSCFGALTADELVRLAASVEQVSTHPFAPAVLAEARARGLAPAFPTEVREEMGAGISGGVDGRRVAVGRPAFAAPGQPLPAEGRSVESRTAVEGSSAAWVSVDGVLAGALILQDPLRPEAPRALRELRRNGIERIHMVTGDHPDVAELVGDALGVDRVFAERTPDEKVEVVRQVRPEGITVMVGDGLNDAPALALADVGVAMGARGATAASEAADLVLTADRVEGLVHAHGIARRTRTIALQSVFVGMGLSVAAMIVAAAGYLPPVAGALLQEGIDVVVILNALRALGGPSVLPRATQETRSMAAHLAEAHGHLRPAIESLAELAARLDAMPAERALVELRRVHALLDEEILPHEREEQAEVYPVIARMLQPEDPTGPLTRTHHELHRLTRLLGRQIDRLAPEGPTQADLRDLRRVLYGLHALLTLHFAQEEELYSLLDA